MLEAALQTLRERYAVVGFTENFDTMLATLITLCGWPDIIYSQYQTRTVQLEDDMLSTLREECSLLNRYDQMLYGAIRRDGAIQLGPIGQDDPPPPIDDSVIIVADELKAKDGSFPTLPKAEIDDFNAWAHREKIQVTKN